MAEIMYRRGVPGVVPSTWLIHPDTATKAPPLVAVHGIRRETEVMSKLLVRRAVATGRTVVLPIFDETSWPRYQRAACKNRSDWAFLALLKILRSEGHIGEGPVDLSGFSGGAQFAHRFAWLYPQHVGRLCLAAPGWWTFPDTRGAFPLAMGAATGGGATGAFRLQANLLRFLDRQIHVTVGALDTTQDRNLRQDPDIVDQQGRHRVERARNWTDAVIRATRQAGLRPRVSFRLMDNCGHSFSDCIANGDLDQDFIPNSGITSRKCPCTSIEQLVEVA